MEFNYEILKETDKAAYIKVPYYEETSEYVKKHKQLFYECWIPKSILSGANAKAFVLGKRNEIRVSNPYQKRFCSMPNSWNTLGQYAPPKAAQIIDVFDDVKHKELVRFYESKYGTTLRRLIIDMEGANGYVAEEDYSVISQLEFPSLKHPNVPKKQITVYK